MSKGPWKKKTVEEVQEIQSPGIPVMFRKFQAIVSNPRGAQLFVKPDLESEKIGVLRHRQSVQVRLLENDMAKISDNPDKWCDIMDLQRIDTGLLRRR